MPSRGERSARATKAYEGEGSFPGMHHDVETLSEDEIERLGERFGLDVGDEGAGALAEAVNERLTAGLDGVFDVAADDAPTEPGDRSWSPPTDRYNALSTSCHVPPTGDDTGPLWSTTVGVKDNVAVAGVPMQCGSAVMQGFTPTGDATVTTRLREAGGTITAKTNLDEFAGGGRGRSFRGLILNPRDEKRIAGGSSGGSAAAVAAGLVDVAIGTDTGGSIRKPAAFCGLVGLKPTYGLVPLTGVVENTHTLDHVGPIARTVAGAARVLEAIAGKDPRDPASMAAAGRDSYRVGGYLDAVEEPPDLGDVRLGVVTQARSDPLDEPVASRHEEALDVLADRGVTLVETDLPFLDQVDQVKNVVSYVELAAYWRDRAAPVRRGGVVSPADQAEFARRADAGNRELNDFYRARLFAGAQLLSADGGHHYCQALSARHALRSELTARLAGLDALVTPTVPYLAPTVEEVRDPGFDYDGLERPLGYGRYTRVANVTGHPAVTVPNALAAGPAVGLQLVGHSFDEAGLLRTARGVGEPLGPDAA